MKKANENYSILLFQMSHRYATCLLHTTANCISWRRIHRTTQTCTILLPAGLSRAGSIVKNTGLDRLLFIGGLLTASRGVCNLRYKKAHRICARRLSTNEVRGAAAGKGYTLWGLSDLEHEGSHIDKIHGCYSLR
jgi:hypothetical protein